MNPRGSKVTTNFNKLNAMLKSFKTTLACKKKFGYDVTMDARSMENFMCVQLCYSEH